MVDVGLGKVVIVLDAGVDGVGPTLSFIDGGERRAEARTPKRGPAWWCTALGRLRHRLVDRYGIARQDQDQQRALASLLSQASATLAFAFLPSRREYFWGRAREGAGWERAVVSI